jgi:hypothetical protein
MSSVAPLSPLYGVFPNYLINATNFGRKAIVYKIFIRVYPRNLSEIFVILIRTERYVIKMYIGVHIKYLLFLSYFKETSILSRDFEKSSNFMKIWPMRAKIFHADRRTDGHDEGISRFSEFCKLA